ncbi:IS256 family transposase [soil metagenome]
MARYHAQHRAPGTTAAVILDTLEAVCLEGAGRMLAAALAAEVDAFLERPRYAPGGRSTGYRNGFGREREVGIGTWSVRVRAPRVSDLPAGSEPFESAILPRRRYLSQETQRLFARLYLEGLSTGDFEPAFRELMGERATLSPSTIVRLKERWAAEHEAWRARPLDARYAYVWADGIYLGAGLEPETSCLLVVIGAREDGRKELLAMELGYRESTESWAGVLRDLRERGLRSPLLAVGDGALGLWAALREVFPATRHQRCRDHKAMNVLDRLPRRLQAEARRRLQAIWGAPTRAEATAERDTTVAWLRGGGQADAAATLLRDWDDLVTFYDLPAEHWRHLRTSNVVESVFAGVRLRTTVAKRARVRENALYLVFKIVERLAGSWRTLNGGATIMTLLLAGAVFRDGVLIEHPARRAEVPMAA